MPWGPGKYDDLCTTAFDGAKIKGRGGVIVIVIDGDRGSGFSVQADIQTLTALPLILEDVAKEIREAGGTG
jgi:hypothetical protein